MKHWIIAACVVAHPAFALDVPHADIVFLGEQHDNPEHHRLQAQAVDFLSAKALVFEMLTVEQAARITPELLADETALEQALGWNDSGWPDFSIYYPIFAAAEGASFYGAAVPREETRGVSDQGLSAVFGDGADRFGLDQPLPADQQDTREAMQMAAHCDKLPEQILPLMVDIQRLRDARLAEQALQALQDTGGPVAVITGNGHARKDWGAPHYVTFAAPDVSVTSIGLGEEGASPDGGFDTVESTKGVDRGDPCAAFDKS